MLPSEYRLKKRTEFQYSYKHGQTKKFNEFILVIFKLKDKFLRIGFSVSKKVGKAIVRNKTKRQLRAIVRKYVFNINRGYNLIFVAYPNITLLSFEEMNAKIYNGLKSLNLLKEKENDSI